MRSERRATSTLSLVLLFVMIGASIAGAAPRKRLVVLGFDGDRASQFRGDLVAILKKRHTVVGMERWEATADDLSASVMDEDNIRRVATKLKIDGIVTASSERRCSDYILRINLFAGSTGELFSNTVYIKARGPKLGKAEERDLQDELLVLIADLGTSRPAPAREDSDEPAEPEESSEASERMSVSTRSSDDGDEEMLTIDDDAPAEEEEPEPAAPPRKATAPRAKPQKVAARRAKPAKTPRPELEVDEAKIEIESDTEDDPLGLSQNESSAADEDEQPGTESETDRDEPETDLASAGQHLSPAERAIDAVVGLSVTKRTLAFTYDPAQTQKPPSFDGVPVAGLLIDATVYPFAVGHQRDGKLKHLGATLLYDKVLLLKLASFAPMGEAPVEVSCAQQRYALGLTYRYPVNDTATSPVVGAKLSYGRQSFSAQQPPPGHTVPSNVSYSIVEPAVFMRYPVSPKLVLDAELGLLVIRDSGQIESAEHYGRADKRGFEGEVGGEYRFTEKIFGRAALRLETIGLDLAGGGAKSMGVTKARDSYYGATFAAGYAF